MIPVINTLFPTTKEIRTHLLEDERLELYLYTLAHHHRETYLHTLRVCSLSLDLGLENGLESPLLLSLGYASLLHDIGKILVPQVLLAKSTDLNLYEQRLMHAHVRLSFLLLADFQPNVVKEIVVAHHEFSRSPYPRNGADRRNAQRGTSPRRSPRSEIVPAVQILAIADMFDALAQPRAYKPAYQKGTVETVLRHEFTGETKLISQVLHRLDQDRQPL